MKFVVYFEIYGKKLKTEVVAKSQKEAEDIVRSKIIFHKIEADWDSLFDICNNIFPI